MDRDYQTQRLRELIQSQWGAKSISVQNRISNIRALINLLGGDYLRLDPIAMEIETISGTALGFGDEIIPEDDLDSMLEQIAHLRKELELIDNSQSSV